MRIAAITIATILLSTGLVAAQPAPASRGNPTAAPLAPGPAPRGNTATARAPGAANEFKTEAEAKSRCPTGNVVWMNLGSHVYHVPGTKDYGHTKRGAYMCQADADKIGRAAKDEKSTGR